MCSRLKAALVISTLAVAGCSGGTPADIRAKIAEFQDRANAGRLNEIRREYTPVQSDWEKYMRRRAELGRMIASTEALADDVTGHYRLVRAHYNTEFERGHAVETFSFRIDRSGPHLISYGYEVGKRVWCPTITVWASQCSIEDAPASLRSAR